MGTRINGDNVTVPGSLYLTAWVGSPDTVAIIGPGGEVKATTVSLANLELLGSATPDNTPDLLVKRSSNGSFSAQNATLYGNATIQGDSNALIFNNAAGTLKSQLIWRESIGALGLEVAGNLFIVSSGNVTISGASGFATQIGGNIMLLPDTGYPPGTSSGLFFVTNATAGGEWTGEPIRIKNSRLQLQCPDNTLFYDLTIRLVAGVPTIAVEGAGEV
ncbi:MAG TPA: hypothetical protein VFU31_19270 [Candidatus Binatia bacterium]|nr:hypothetical protein [Candidatus Binatia bacterium]